MNLWWSMLLESDRLCSLGWSSCSHDRVDLAGNSPCSTCYSQLNRRLITHTQPFYGSVGFVWDNPGEPVPEETFTHSHSSWSSIIPICFLHLLRSMASSLFNPCALQSFSKSLSNRQLISASLSPPRAALPINLIQTSLDCWMDNGFN